MAEVVFSQISLLTVTFVNAGQFLGLWYNLGVSVSLANLVLAKVSFISNQIPGI